MAMTFSMTEGDILNDHQRIARVLHEALPYIDFLKGKTIVIKLGGSTLEHQRVVLQDVIWLRTLGVHPVIVHGGGPSINAWLEKLHVPTRFENGLRVTDAETLEVVQMVLLGQVNANLVAMASQLGGKAVGISGTDGNMISARVASERLGFVGEIERVDPALVQTLIEQGYIPIVAPLGQGPGGTCLNINADLVAAHLAGALKAEKLIFDAVQAFATLRLDYERAVALSDHARVLAALGRDHRAECDEAKAIADKLGAIALRTAAEQVGAVAI